MSKKMYIFEAIYSMSCEGVVYADSPEEAMEKIRNEQYDDLSDGTLNVDEGSIEITEERNE